MFCYIILYSFKLYNIVLYYTRLYAISYYSMIYYIIYNARNIVAILAQAAA